MDINERKKQLIQRSPLGKDFNRKLRAHLANPTLDSFVRLRRLICEIEGTWAVNIRFPSETMDSPNSKLENCWDVLGEIPIMVEDARKEIYWGFRAGEFIKHGFSIDNLVFCPSNKIPIIIDPQVMTLNDARKVKKDVWDIVEKEIKKIAKRRNESATYFKKLAEKNNNEWPDIAEELQESPFITNDKQINTIALPDISPGGIAEYYQQRSLPPHEPEKLSMIYYCKEETFIKYLRWFDLKMEGMNFSSIAHHEGIKGGESTVRKGFNEIYRAIYRKEGPTEEEKIATVGNYDCPRHGSDCPRGCQYLKE
jgi:hypothetical protein